ncbi:MAG: hypothetical protein U9Q06_04775 [Nanoarchaeota archaeon]|nr:hypothetical protein [Nanoarchaeota archaeon]
MENVFWDGAKFGKMFINNLFLILKRLMMIKNILLSLGLGSSLQSFNSFNLYSPFFRNDLTAFFYSLLLFGLYLYYSITYSKIGKKAGLTNPGIAWMPIFGPLAVIFEASKKHWWPFLMVSLEYFLILILMFGFFGLNFYSEFISGIFYISYFLIFLIFSIMVIIWHWKTYVAVGKSGWWILVPVILVFFSWIFSIIATISSSKVIQIIAAVIFIVGFISHLIFIGIAAWSGNPQLQQIS